MIVYVIKNKVNDCYVGMTSEAILHKLNQHCNRKIQSTKNLNNEWKLIHKWEVPEYMYASKLRRYMIKLSGVQKESTIADFPVYTTALKRLVARLPTTLLEMQGGKSQ